MLWQHTTGTQVRQKQHHRHSRANCASHYKDVWSCLFRLLAPLAPAHTPTGRSQAMAFRYSNACCVVCLLHVCVCVTCSKAACKACGRMGGRRFMQRQTKRADATVHEMSSTGALVQASHKPCGHHTAQNPAGRGSKESGVGQPKPCQDQSRPGGKVRSGRNWGCCMRQPPNQGHQHTQPQGKTDSAKAHGHLSAVGRSQSKHAQRRKSSTVYRA